MREWLVIENSWQNSVFAPDRKGPRGYIPRDAAEQLLGRSLVEPEGRVTWFTREDGEKMRAHPEWRTTEPPVWSSPLGFWLPTTDAVMVAR